MSLKHTLVFWNESSPLFRYTCAFNIKNKLITGTNGGFCVLWNFENNEYIPFSLLYGHQTKVTDVCGCSYDGGSNANTPTSNPTNAFGTENNNCFCSISVDGTLCVWNSHDGRCMALSSNLLFEVSPQCICNISKYSNYNSSIVAISGKHNMIYLVDVNRLKIIKVLESHMEWVSSLSSGPFLISDNQIKTVMLSVGDDHSFKYWTFELDNKTHNIKGQDPLFSIQTSMVQNFKPVMILNNDEWSFIIVVYPKVVYVYNYHSIHPNYTILPNNDMKNDRFKGAIFLSSDLLLIYTSKGIGLVYKIPSLNNSKNMKTILSCINTNNSTNNNSNNQLNDDIMLYNAGDDEDESNVPSIEVSENNGVSVDTMNIKNNGLMDEKNNITGSTSTNSLDSGIKKKQPNLQLTIPTNNNIPTVKSNDVLPNMKSASTNNLPKNSQSVESLDDSVVSSPHTPSVVDFDISSFTSIGAAIERAASTSITNSIIQSSPSTPNFTQLVKEHPKLIYTLESDRSKDDPYGDFVWHFDQQQLIRINNGIIKVWKVKFEKSFIDFELLSDSSKLSSGWSSIPVSPRETTSPVSVSHFAVDRISPCLIKGYHNGDIHIQYTTMKASMNTHQSLLIPKAHSKRVTTLLVMSDDDNNPLLISGSADYTIKVWQLDSTDFNYCKLLKTFHYHTGAVNLLFVPPRTIRRKLQNCFCSLSDDDHNVILYSIKTLDVIHILGGHGSTVVSIYWRGDLDYLLVQCSDGTVCVWSISTGLLERRVSGYVAKSLIKTSEQSSLIGASTATQQILQSEQLSSSSVNSGMNRGGGAVNRGSIMKLSFSKQSAMAESYNKARGFVESVSLQVNPQSPDIQLLTISVRRMIGFIQSKKDLLTRYFSNQPNSTPTDIDEVEVKLNDRNMATLLCALSYLIQYGNDPSVKQLRQSIYTAMVFIQNQNQNEEYYQQMITDALNNQLLSYPKGFIGLKGAGDTYSLIVPNKSDKSHPFIFSPVLSSIHIIGVVAVLNALSTVLPASLSFQQICKDCITYYLTQLHADFDQFQEPSFLWCSQFLRDISKDVQIAAKSVMFSVLQRMEFTQQKQLAEKLANMLLETSGTKSSKQLNSQRQNIVVALALLAYRVPRAVDGRIATITAMELIDILEKGGPQHSSAITLLGDGYSIWKYYIPDAMGFCRQLFQLSLPALTSQIPGNNNVGTDVSLLAADSLQAFVNMASADTRLYIEFINNIITNAQQSSTTTLNAAISSLYPIMQKHPKCLMDHLVVVTSLLLKVLDPHLPAIRDVCMANSTNILRFMVEIYPMVSFHQEKQKLAIGSIDGNVVIYDMRTASKWQLFEAHKNCPIHALSFSPNGQYLSSFSSVEKSCKIWNTDGGSGGAILSLLGVNNRCVKTFTLDNMHVKDQLKPMEILKFVRFEWDNNKTISLKPGKNLNKVTFRL